jgi:hypothetical protein
VVDFSILKHRKTVPAYSTGVSSFIHSPPNQRAEWWAAELGESFFKYIHRLVEGGTHKLVPGGANRKAIRVFLPLAGRLVLQRRNCNAALQTLSVALPTLSPSVKR